MLAVSIMLIAGVLTWKDILAEKGAWDAMFWMGGLMALATVLSKSGFIKWAAAFIADGIADAHMGWISSFLIISLIYIYSHYCFASVTASISAMYAAFVAVAAACGAPALMVAVAFGIFANLPISLTHYGNGAVPVYFGEIAFAFQKVVQLGTQGLLFCIQRILRYGPGQRQGGHCKE